MSNNNQTQLAREEYSLDQLRAMVDTSFLPAHASDYYGAVKQLFAVLTERRALNGSEQSEPCTWTLTDDRRRKTACGSTYPFNSTFKFCPYCSRTLLTTEQGDEDLKGTAAIWCPTCQQERVGNVYDYGVTCQTCGHGFDTPPGLVVAPTEQGVSGRGEGGDDAMLERMEAECDLRLQVRMDSLMEQGYSENHARIIAEEEDKPTIQQ